MSSEWGSIGWRIAFRREELGLSQAKLAKLCHVNPMTVSKWERDVLKPTRNIMELAEALDVTATWILRGHFELAITKEKKDEALNAAKRAVNLAAAARSLLESLPVGEKLYRPMMEQLFNWLHGVSRDANYAMSLLPNPMWSLKTTKQREAMIGRMERDVEREFPDGEWAKIQEDLSSALPGKTYGEKMQAFYAAKSRERKPPGIK